MPSRIQGSSRKPAPEDHTRSGAWLRELRERRGLTQRELAQQVGAQCYTVIAQLEHGRGHIPPHHVPTWARALGVAPHELAGRFAPQGGVLDGASDAHDGETARATAQVYWLHPPAVSTTEVE